MSGNMQPDSSSRIACNICRPNKLFRCPGHGGGGGGSGSGSGNDNSDSEKKSSLGTENKNVFTSTIDTTANVPTAMNTSMMQQPATQLCLFNADVIAELISKKLFFIDNNRELGILHIRCNPNLSPDQKNELNLFLHALQNEFFDFKNKHGLSDQSCKFKVSRDSQDNILSLTISISNPQLYDQFIQQLMSKHLFSITDVKQSKKAVPEINNSEKPKKYSTPSPFSSMKRPRPKGLES